MRTPAAKLRAFSWVQWHKTVGASSARQTLLVVTLMIFSKWVCTAVGLPATVAATVARRMSAWAYLWLLSGLLLPGASAEC